MRISILCLFCLILVNGVNAEEIFPGDDWQEKPSPYASPHAYPGGEMSFSAHQFPKSLNYYLDSTVSSSRIFIMLYETLLGLNPTTLDFEPNLAKQWRISDDKMTFTFHMDEHAKWSDGQPVTAHDVAWTFKTILDPMNLTGAHKIALERFNDPEVIDDYTISFKAKEAHWQNLLAIGQFQILPKHAYEQLDFNKINFDFPVVSGPYDIQEVREGIQVVLEKRYDWWQIDFPRNEGLVNFDTLRHRFYANTDNAFEAFKAGDIDVFAVYASYRWATETSGKNYDMNWIVKQEVYNYEPVSFQGFAMNMRRPKFSDKRVRMALAHLLDRRRMNNTLMYNAYFLHQCYYHDLYDEEHQCQAPLIEFDKSRARELLSETGWKVNQSTGFLEKDGQPFIINFLTRDPSSDKFLAIYREDLQDVGIQLNIVRKDWAAWIKDMDEYNYDMTWAAWGAAIYKDPEPMWYSKEADRPAGVNITGYKNPEVDKLVLAQRAEFDINKRNEINRKIDGIVASEVPYILLWNLNYTRMLYWNKFGTPEAVLGRISDESGAFYYWWYDEDAAADLEYSMDNNLQMPGKPFKTYFDDIKTH